MHVYINIFLYKFAQRTGNPNAVHASIFQVDYIKNNQPEIIPLFIPLLK